ncbi:hypothetical protein E4T56_gene18275 [Termitomyces sp. T112]|nr:hypothetical protein E4T56_gene18275 [Termitomyces sp. T112]
MELKNKLDLDEPSRAPKVKVTPKGPRLTFAGYRPHLNPTHRGFSVRAFCALTKSRDIHQVAVDVTEYIHTVARNHETARRNASDSNGNEKITRIARQPLRTPLRPRPRPPPISASAPLLTTPSLSRRSKSSSTAKLLPFTTGRRDSAHWPDFPPSLSPSPVQVGSDGVRTTWQQPIPELASSRSRPLLHTSKYVSPPPVPPSVETSCMRLDALDT